MNVEVSVKVDRHACGTEYCLFHVSPVNDIETSFSFSLVYLYKYVKNEDRPWFVKEVIGRYMDSEMRRKYPKELNFNYTVINVDDVLGKCQEIFSLKSIS